LVRIQLLVFVLKFSHSKPSNMTCFIRIFRVLHTVQSSVFKVLYFRVAVSAATFKGYHNWLFLSTIFLFFFKTFSSLIDVF
jgi:hypothetical protein